MESKAVQEYIYCMVRFDDLNWTFSYITEDESLQAGEFVSVPFGKEDRVRVGQVMKVIRCTKADAPYPPERTKHVLARAEKPAQWGMKVRQQQTAADPGISERTKPADKASVDQSSAERAKQTARQVVGQRAAVDPGSSARVKPRNKAVPPERKRRFDKKSVRRLLLVLLLFGGLLVLGAVEHQQQQAQEYEKAMQALADGDYAAAEKLFEKVPDYRDAQGLAVFCEYAGLYESRNEYVGGSEELREIDLRYDTGWQAAINTLRKQVAKYKADQDAEARAEQRRQAAEEQKRLKKLYGGKLPVEGMPVSCLKYTSLGEPDEEVKCLDFDRLEEDHRSFRIYWYTDDHELLASGLCFKHENDSEYMLYSFGYFDPKKSSRDDRNGGNSGNGGTIPWGGVRDDYDNPEDLWEDNPGDYEDEDEAWDEWYDDGDEPYDE